MDTRITIVYDNDLNKQGLETGWGFSALIETDHASPILFDTGNDGAALVYNMEKLGIDPELISVIVISHGHYDHTGGLGDILEINDRATIYLPASAATTIPGRKVITVSQPLQITDNVFSTGELKNMEQSLAIKTGRGIVVVTGCSHPGVGTILDAASSLGEIHGIIGGFHGFNDFSRLNGLSLICPCHCTQYKKELARRFPEQYVECGSGLELVI
ncbi:MAG: MBL fold metallo-hydrolase [Dehalococcoidales bacterium]|nr:MBL fold metallo-hydrolase [Dehalococcoidales bacterium]